MRNLSLISATLLCLLSPRIEAQTARFIKEYEIQRLGLLHPNGYGYAGDLNNLGEATGTGLAPNGMSEHGWIYSNGTLTDLGTLGSTYSWGLGINDDTTVVGYSMVSSLVIHAFEWSNGSMQLMDPGGYNFSRANAINHLGDTVGILNGFFGGFQTTLRGYVTTGGLPTVLDTFGGTESRAEDINDHGQITGMARNANGQIRGFLHDTGVMNDIGDLGDTYCWPLAINDKASIVGRARIPGGLYRAFRHDGASPQDLGTLGGAESEARDINNRGEIVGQAEDALGNQRAFHLFRGRMRDLNELVHPSFGWMLTGAGAINELGQILGTGRFQGVRHAYLLTPIREDLLYSGAVPGVAGTSANAHVAGGQPGSTVHLYFGTAAGTTDVPGCPSLGIDIASPQLAGSALIDSDGRASIPVVLPASLSGMTIRSQVVDAGTCRVSRVATQTF